MKGLIHILLVASSLLISAISSNAQEIKFKAFKSSQGTIAKNLTDIYAWGPWNLDNTGIVINLTKGVVKVNDSDFEIIERPKNWVVKKDFKYVSFACTTPNFDKANIKLYQYDRGEFRIYVNEEKKATRYVVQYLDSK